jgi:hypothetical protein
VTRHSKTTAQGDAALDATSQLLCEPETRRQGLPSSRKTSSPIVAESCCVALPSPFSFQWLGASFAPKSASTGRAASCRPVQANRVFQRCSVYTKRCKKATIIPPVRRVNGETKLMFARKSHSCKEIEDGMRLVGKHTLRQIVTPCKHDRHVMAS